MRLENKVAIVTGGAGGMGRSTVMRFIEEGAKVVIADYNAASGAETLAEITSLGYKNSAHFIKTDVASELDIKAMVECAVDNFGRVDIMFNNAGVGGVVGPVWDLQVEEWDYTFDVLVKGVFLGIKHAAKVMRAQGDGGVIINTASVAGLSGGCGPLSYSAAKAAVVNLTKAAAVQLAPDRIRVNAICPGFILTGLTHSKHDSLEQAGKRMDSTQPFPDHGTGEDIAGTALFLATEDSRFVNGEAIVVDGALTAIGPDMWQRWGVPYERDMTSNVVNKGTTGDKNTRRQLGD
ncbi:MAG: SDR family NAD(P)-dependent oxidoreductase [Gammaproteobacteria bacterium]|jgi:NAD(P)-dependent dehydrogenase (short-subunit alcohol dehydrogenase family)|tara:strand:+ start:4162 stop:5037 length:876 start_codon:yes stop_codon:yes gene_type:complete